MYDKEMEPQTRIPKSADTVLREMSEPVSKAKTSPAESSTIVGMSAISVYRPKLNRPATAMTRLGIARPRVMLLDER